MVLKKGESQCHYNDRIDQRGKHEKFAFHVEKKKVGCSRMVADSAFVQRILGFGSWGYQSVSPCSTWLFGIPIIVPYLGAIGFCWRADHG